MCKSTPTPRSRLIVSRIRFSPAASFGVVVWDVVCGEGEAPWAGVSVNELPLTLKMGTRLDIPAQCGRFYRCRAASK